MATYEMELRENSVFIGHWDSDPFLSDQWPHIVADVQRRFPGVDLITFDMSQYVGLASISESLDPMQLTQYWMSQGIMCMGSNKKVNLMTQDQIADLVKHINQSIVEKN